MERNRKHQVDVSFRNGNAMELMDQLMDDADLISRVAQMQIPEDDDDEITAAAADEESLSPPSSKKERGVLPSTTTTTSPRSKLLSRGAEDAVSFRNLTDVIENAKRSSMLDHRLDTCDDDDEESFDDLQDVIEKAKRISLRDLKGGGDNDTDADVTAAATRPLPSYAGESFSNMQHVMEQAKRVSLKEMDYQASYSREFESLRYVIVFA